MQKQIIGVIAFVLVLAGLSGSAGDQTRKVGVNATPAHTTILEEQGIDKITAQTLERVGEQFGIDLRYLATVGLSENILNPDGVGDNGCSFGPFQINTCVHTDIEQSGLCTGQDMKAVALNTECAAYRLAWNITSNPNFGCEVQANGLITNWIHCLSNWNGYSYPAWYAEKIQANGYKLNLK